MNSLRLDFNVIRLGIDDALSMRHLIDVFRDVFEMTETATVRMDHLEKLMELPGFIAIVVKKDDVVVGGLTAYELPMYYSARAEIFLYDIGVRQDFQRLGLGTMLLSALKEYALQKDIQEIFVAAHAEDRHARDFYLAAGGKPEQVVHFSFPCDRL